MRIHEETKKCVAFLQYKMADGSFKYAGTCFFVFIEKNNKGYVVSAKHVLEKIKSFGLDKAFIKVNLQNHTTETIPTNIDSWTKHPDVAVDIAIYPFVIKEHYDHLYYPRSSFMTPELAQTNEIDCGDEVFITGLFKHHTGNTKNSPIVRIGNIALMPNEIIQMKDHEIDAYLIESRSIGGLSGSPVFVNLGIIRKLNNKIQHAEGNHIPLLFGLIYGHFDSKSYEIDSANTNNEQEKINVGIAIVTPVSKLIQMLD